MKTFIRRTSNVFHNQKRRARKIGQSLHYELEDIRVIVNNAIGKPCPYCGVALCVTTCPWITRSRRAAAVAIA